jgi:hypothetical protein
VTTAVFTDGDGGIALACRIADFAMCSGKTVTVVRRQCATTSSEVSVKYPERGFTEITMAVSSGSRAEKL